MFDQLKNVILSQQIFARKQFDIELPYELRPTIVRLSWDSIIRVFIFPFS